MKRALQILLAFIVATFIGSNVHAQTQAQWKESSREISGKSVTDPRATDGVEIFSSDDVITIRTPKKIQVRVFTILGQLVSQASLPPGTSELRLNSRGIFLVKTEHITQKVVL